MVKVSSSQCKCFSSLGCDVYRSEEKLPAILSEKSLHIIEWVMDINNTQTINQTYREEYLYNKGNKYTSKKLKFVIENGHLFINSDIGPKVLTMKALFSNPLAPEIFNEINCGEGLDKCRPMTERDFYLEEDLENILVDMAAKQLIEVFTQMREDKTNDTSDSLKQQSK